MSCDSPMDRSNSCWSAIKINTEIRVRKSA